MVNIKVFVSSDMKELNSERQAVIETIQSLGKSPIFFEAFPASPEAPRAVYLKEVADADIFIQVIGRSVSNPVKEEYEAAYARIPGRILVFIKNVPHDLSATYQVSKIKGRHTYKEFSTLEELGGLVTDAVRALEASAIRSYGGIEEAKGQKVLYAQQVFFPVGSNEWTSPKIWLERGDRVRGLVEGGSKFRALILDQENYADWSDGKRYSPLVRSDLGRKCAVNVSVRKDAFHYLVVQAKVPLFLPFGVTVELYVKRASQTYA